MQINATTFIPPTKPADHTANKVKAVDQPGHSAPGTTAPGTPSKVFTPAPPLRPNVQDIVDFDLTLIKLKQSRI